jgi:NADH dehydrogenase [ubiquinone] 1 alpha subcomplex assembly factor 1
MNLLLTSILLLGGQELITSFSPSDQLNWGTVHDTVMGGRSSGRILYTQEETMLFKGNVSLENNGGFASIRSRGSLPQLALDSDGLEIKIKGSGREYYFSCTHKQIALWGGGYWQKFKTKKDEWLTIQLPWENFIPRNYGMKMNNLPKMSPKDLAGLGIYMYDKKSGPFELEIDYIQTYKNTPVAKSESENSLSNYLETDHSILFSLLNQTRLIDKIETLQEFTIFAPKNSAFEQLPKELLTNLLLEENQTVLYQILLNHVAQGQLTAFNAIGKQAVSLAGNSLPVKWSNEKNQILVSGIPITKADNLIGKRVVHIPASPIIPSIDLNDIFEKDNFSISQFINRSINYGTPLFNAGYVEFCVDIYKADLKFLASRAELQRKDQENILLALSSAESMGETNAAWRLRSELDRLIRVY